MLVSPASADFNCSARAVGLELPLGNARTMDAGDAGGDQQLREAALACRGTERYAVEQNLSPRRAEQNAAPAAFVQSAAQFLPGGLELRRGAHVPEFIQAREFQQNIQAAYERPRGTPCIGGHRLTPRTACSPVS